MGQKLVIGIDANAILELAAHLGGDLQHETVLALVGQQTFPLEAVVTGIA